MKHLGFAMVLLLFGGLCSACKGSEFSEGELARRHGAQAKICFQVTDSIGNSVHGARLRAYFSSSDAHLNDDFVDELTDTNGLVAAEGRTVGDMSFFLSKDGFYKTEGRNWFYTKANRHVQNGRWQPWNPTNTVILKEKRNPIPMYAMFARAAIPVQDQPIGFDMEVGDWVAPFGKGKIPDLQITYSAKIEGMLTYSNRLVIAGNQPGDGFQRHEKESWSDFVSAYEAPLDGYLPEVVLTVERTTHQIIKRELLGDSEYLFVRTRTTLDPDGNVSSAQYAKIYGPIKYGDDEKGGGLVYLTYFLNPTPNDRNMEFEPTRNLLPGRVHLP